MYLSPEHKKILIIFSVTAVIVALMILLLPNVFLSNTINANFEKGTLTAGETTDLSVVVINTLDKDISSLEVSIESFSPSISIANSPQTETLVGKGESRKFIFPITVAEGARPGEYSLEITAKLGSKEEIIKTSLEVKG